MAEAKAFARPPDNHSFINRKVLDDESFVKVLFAMVSARGFGGFVSWRNRTRSTTDALFYSIRQCVIPSESNSWRYWLLGVGQQEKTLKRKAQQLAPSANQRGSHNGKLPFLLLQHIFLEL